jgi:hypothetical protein
MKRLIVFLMLFIICTPPLVPASDAMQKTEAASDNGHFLWQFDSGG